MWAEVPASATTPILLSLVTVWIGLVTWAALAERRASGGDDDEAGIDPVGPAPAAAAASAPAQD